MRWLLIIACSIGLSSLTFDSASADNDLVRGLVTKAVKESLVGYNSKDAGWHQSQKANRQQWSTGELFGLKYKTLIAEWTEETKVWVWLDQPERNLAVQLNNFVVADNRVHYDLVISGKANFNAWGKIERLAKGDFKGHCKASVRIAGSFGVTAGGLVESQVTVSDGSVSDVHFNNDLMEILRQPIQRELNAFISGKTEELRGKLNLSLNSVKF